MFDSGFLLRLPALLIAISFHEYAHARVAHELGDPTPGYQGRLTVNPLAHIDPIGMLMLWVFRFGWAKPVLVNPSYFRDPRRGMLYVSLAGPAANVLLAFVSLLILKLSFFSYASPYRQVIWWILQYNLLLSVFNLIPIPPLDGSKVLGSLLPVRYSYITGELERYGFLILILLIWTGAIGAIMMPLAQILYGALDLVTGILTGALRF